MDLYETHALLFLEIKRRVDILARSDDSITKYMRLENEGYALSIQYSQLGAD